MMRSAVLATTLAGVTLCGLVQAQTATTVSLTSVTPGEPIFGQTVTFTAQVIPSTASGSVSFLDQGTLVGTANVNSSGVAQSTTLTLSAGKHSLRAVYGGSPKYEASQSAVLPYVVTALPGAGFALAVNYPPPPIAAPTSVAVGDFNADGIADLTVANGYGISSKISVMLGKGDGTFHAAVNYPINGSPLSIVIADFNGDGKEDIATAVSVGYGAGVLLGNGDGTFQPVKYYAAAGNQPISMAVGDFNGDGKIDLAVGNQCCFTTTSGLSILLGNGDGSFQTPLAIPVYTFPVSISVADINGDGIADVVLGVFGGGPDVLLGNGDGTFQMPTYDNVGYFGGAAAVADLNGDGILDLAVAGGGASPYQSNIVSVLLGNGDGTFQNPVGFTAGINPAWATVGDFNGDGKPDLAVANGSSDNLSILLGNGDGTFQAPVDYPTLNGPGATAIADFNGDGIADVAVVDEGSYVLSVLLGEPPGTPPAAATTTSLNASPNPASSSQPVTLTATVIPAAATGTVEFLDGTTVLAVKPLVSGQAETSGSFFAAGKNALHAIYSGAPGAFLSSQSSIVNQSVNPASSGGFRVAATVATAEEASGLAVGDFNGDGRNDLAVAQLNVVSIFLGNGDGTFQAGMTYPIPSAPGWVPVAVSDFNGDGFADLLVNGSMLLGNGDGTFQPAQSTGGFLVADFNNDGAADLAGGNGVQLGYGNGKFHTALPLGDPKFGGTGTILTVGDFNGDGKPDVAAVNSSTNSVSVMLGNGDGSLQVPVNYAVPSGASSLVAGDFNGDGLPDLAVTDAYDLPSTASVLLNNGSGVFPATVTFSASSSSLLAVGDFNGDGKADLATGGPGAPFLSILLGKGDGTFQSPLEYYVGSSAIAVGDFNGDGRSDIAVSSGGVSILLGVPSTTSPSPIAVSPGAGSGDYQTFTFTFQDPNGYADLQILDILTNTFLDGQAACYVAFLPLSATTGMLYLVDDEGDSGGPFAGSFLVNGSGTGSIANSQCSIYAAQSSVSAAGNTLILNLGMSFASRIAGNNVFYMAARSPTQNSGWQALGTWNVPGPEVVGPAVGSVAPGRSVSTGQTYTFTFTDTAGYSDLSVLDIVTNSFLDGISACYVAYVPTGATTGYLYLVDDAGDGGYASGSPLLLSSGGTLKNSQCTINTAASSASASGNTLNLNLGITFSSSFAGNQVFYLAARNNSTGNSGWRPLDR